MKRIKLEVIEEDDDDDFDPHITCPAYPNCDLSPLGCTEQTSIDDDDFEFTGHK